MRVQQPVREQDVCELCKGSGRRELTKDERRALPKDTPLTRLCECAWYGKVD